MGAAASVKLHRARLDEDDLTVDELLHNKQRLDDYWKRIDFNGNNIVSLAEIDKFVAHTPGFRKLYNKPALIRAWKRTLHVDGDGDDWVQRHEFPYLLRNVYYFNKLWKIFEEIDTGGDRRVDLEEFKAGMRKLHVELTDEEAEVEFRSMDANDGGQVLFDEFCMYIVKHACPTVASIDNGKPVLKAKAKVQLSARQQSRAKTSRVTLLSNMRQMSIKQARQKAAARYRESQQKKAAAMAARMSELPPWLAAAMTPDDELIMEALGDKKKLLALWRELDNNGNGVVSFGEIGEFVNKVPGLQKFNNKAALMRAWQRTLKYDGDGNDWVEKHEFPALLRNIYYFDKLWDIFAELDSDGDSKIGAKEFVAGMAKLVGPVSMSPHEALHMFRQMDCNGGGEILFDEFCVYFGKLAAGTLPSFEPERPEVHFPEIAGAHGKRGKGAIHKTVGMIVGERLHSASSPKAQRMRFRDPERFKKRRQQLNSKLSPFGGPKVVTHLKPQKPKRIMPPPGEL